MSKQLREAIENSSTIHRTINGNDRDEMKIQDSSKNDYGSGVNHQKSTQFMNESEGSGSIQYSNSYEDKVQQVQNNYGLNQSEGYTRSIQVKSQKPKTHPGKLTDETNVVVGAKVTQKIRNYHEESPALPFISQNASMMPDMKFGWKPEVKCSHPPIPTYFDFVEHRLHPYRFEDNIENSDVLVYQQFRPKDTYQMHKKYANQQLKNGCQSYKFNFPKNHEGGRFNDEGLLDKIFGSRTMEKATDLEFIGMNPECEQANKAVPQDQEYSFLPFDADFESGNLDMVIKTSTQKAYDVFLRPDTNTTGYFQWFYFRVKNRCKGTKIRINIVNMTKRNSLYQQGMPIMILSMKKAKEEGANWAFGGENIRYGLSKLMRNQVDEHDENVRQRIYYQLGWEYTFQFDNDEVFFAYSLPYTFSMVTNMIQQVQEQQDKLIQEYRRMKEKETFHDPTSHENQLKVVETSYLTTSLAGMEVPMLTITDFSHSGQDEIRKKVVVITGRVHPGETNASWIVHGIIKFLLGKDKVANELRKRVIFKIIPMINADGVTAGNSRCSLIGRDINRVFGHPNSKLTPEPFSLRALIKELQKIDKHKVQAYLDVHAHSGRKSIFMYGPYFPLHSSKYMKIRTLPKLVSERTEMFRYFSCKFKCEKYKENCARIAIWRDFNITNVYTIETSSMGFLNKERDTVHFNTGLLQEFGECFIHSMFEYHLIQEEDRRMKVKLAKKLKEQRKTKRQTIAEILGRVPNGTRSQKAKVRRNGTGTESQASLENDEIINNIDFTNGPVQVTNINENPNEADKYDEVASPVNQAAIPQQMDPVSDESIDSRAFADSDSSDEGFGSLQINPISDVPGQQQRLHSRYDQLGSQISQPILQQTGGMSQVQQMLMRKKGFEIADGGELFHQLYNPSFQEWKSKRQQYVNYEQLQKQQKMKENRHGRYHSKTFTHGDNRKNKNDQAHENDSSIPLDFSQKQRDQYYMKEVRTFDEVFKAIKNTVKEKQIKRGPSNLKHDHDEPEYDDEDDQDECDIAPLDDEYGNEEDFIDDGDDQEVDQQDREILNERILGIINVFGSIVQNTNNSQSKLNQNQMKMLQDLRQQSLSIEKQVGGARKNTIGNKFEGSTTNYRKEEPKVKRVISKEKIHEESPTRKSIHGYPQLNQNHSIKEIQIQNYKKTTKAQTAKKKKIIHYPEMMFSVNQNMQSFHDHHQPVRQPMMSVYNMGAGPEQVVLQHASKSSSMVTSNKRSSQTKHNIGDYHVGFETQDRRYLTEKKEYIDPHHLTYQGNTMFLDKQSLSSSKRVGNIIKPARQLEYGSVRQPSEQQYAITTNGSQYIIVNSTSTPNAPIQTQVTYQIGSGLKQSYVTQNLISTGPTNVTNDQLIELKKVPQSAIHPTRNMQRNQVNQLSQSNQFYSNSKPTKTQTAGFKRIHSAGKYSNQKNQQNAKNPQWQFDNSERKPSFQQDNNLSVGGYRLKTVERTDSKTLQKVSEQKLNEMHKKIIYQTQQKDYFLNQNHRNFIKIKDLNQVEQDFQEQLQHQLSQTPTPQQNQQQANMEKVFLKNKQQTISVLNPTGMPNQTQAQLNFTNQIIAINNNKFKVKSPQIGLKNKNNQLNNFVSQSMNGSMTEHCYNFVNPNGTHSSIYTGHNNIQSEAQIRSNQTHGGFSTSQNKTYTNKPLSVSTQLKPSLTSTNSHEKLSTNKLNLPIGSASGMIEPINKQNTGNRQNLSSEASLPYKRSHQKSTEVGMNTYGFEEEKQQLKPQPQILPKKANAIITSNQQHTQKLIHDGMKRPKTSKRMGCLHQDKISKSCKKKKIIKSRQQICAPKLENDNLSFDSKNLYAIKSGHNSNNNGQSRKIKYLGDVGDSEPKHKLRQKNNSSTNINPNFIQQERVSQNNSVNSIPEFIINSNI